MYPAMFIKIKENSFFKTLIFAIRHTFLAGKRYWLVMVCAQILSSLMTPLAALLVGKLAGSIKETASAAAQDLSLLAPWILVVALIWLVLAGCRVVVQYCSLCLGDRLILRMQHEVVEHTASLNLEQIEDPGIQNIMERAQRNPGQYLMKFLTGVVDVFTALIRIIGLIGVIFWIAPLWAGVIALLCIPALAVNRYLSFIQFNLKRNKTTARRWSNYYAATLTTRETIPSTVTLGIIPLFLQRFTETVLDINLANQKFYRLRAALTFGLALLMIGIIIGALFALLKYVLGGSLGIEKFCAFLFAAWRMQVCLSGLGKSFFDISESEFNIFNIRELLSTRSTEPDTGTRPPKTPCGRIEIRDLSFTYRGTEQPVLKNISLTIEQGETVAIVGANGSGKTTLAKLVARLYTPTSGHILLDDLPAAEYDRDALYKKISFVTQQPVQFEATASENIAFGDWEALKASPEKVRSIAESTRLDEMIRHMPEGYDTRLGRLFGTYDISGGPRPQHARGPAPGGAPGRRIS
jgi:ABC-type multidrug transport system fused ATPase/permease subunit